MSEREPPITYADWRRALGDGTLLGLECRCGAVTATPKRACPACGSRELAPRELPTTGTVDSETTIAVPPAGHDPGTVAVVDLGPARLLGRIDGTVEIGDRVVFAGARTVDGEPAPVFEPHQS